jgi:branched-chain amino acid transport system ATP-binding protein
VGGLSSLGGAIAAGGVFAALNELFFRFRFLSGWLEVVSAALLGIVLLVYPGGLAALPGTMRSLLGRGETIAEKLRLFKRRESVAAEPEPAAVPGNRRFLTLSRWLPKRAAVVDRPQDWYASAKASSNGPHSPAAESPPPSKNDSPRAGSELTLGSFATPVLCAVRDDRAALVQAEGITVQFGGLRAVDNASLSVREGEIVGLIGPNGAGKTTLFNAILGLNDPVAGTVALHRHDVTHMPPHLRARLGIARTFQVLQLFNELTVFENLLVATHVHNDSNVLTNLAGTRSSLAAEAAARKRVRDIVALLGLTEVAHEGVRNLPFGILRMVELGRALVTGARVMMLDEVASGLNEQETDKLIEVVQSIRALGVSVLLIEHDVRMVTQVSDYVYVLDQGRMIAEGTPDEIVSNQRVIEAYLGGAPQPELESV